MNHDPVRIGYLLPTREAVLTGRPVPSELLDLGRRAEALGLDSLWVGDGLLARPRHEPLTLLGALAAATDRITLGTAVLLAGLRSPVLLAHAAATLDQLASGRLVLGLGAGFDLAATRREYAAAGIPFERRGKRLAETVELMRRLWSSPDGAAFSGECLELEHVAIAPSPHRAGGPPIWLAGGPPVALRRAGALADGWLPYPPSPEQYRSELEAVERAAEDRPPLTAALYVTIAVGSSRSAAERDLKHGIERYYGAPIEAVAAVQAMRAGTAGEIADWLAGYVTAGARHLVVRVIDADAVHALSCLGQVVAPSVRAAALSARASASA